MAVKKNKPKKILAKAPVKKSAPKKVAAKKAVAKKIIPEKVEKKVEVAESPKTPPKQNFVFSPESLFKAKIKVIGIGGGGGSIVSEIGKSLEKATFLIADTDIRALKKRNGIKHFWFGEELTHGLGTGVNVELAENAANQVKEKFKEVFVGQDIVIFIACLGGGLGSGATQIFIDAAKEFNGITLGIFTLPFKFEGKNKSRIALNALKILRQSLNVSLVIPNEKIFKVIDENTPITEAFSMVNKNLTGSLESLIDLIYNPGIINIDFADLKAILRGKGNQAFLNTVEELGKDRAEKTCEKAFINPLLQAHGFAADNILFNIAGSENLSMFEVEKISRHISELNPKAKIIFGISKNPKLKGRIKTTILMTGAGIDGAREIAPEKVQPVQKDIASKPAQKSQNKKKQKSSAVKPNIKPKKVKKEREGVPLNFPEPVQMEPSEVLQNKIEIEDMDLALATDISKRNVRRNGLDIKKAQEDEEKKRHDQEREWEIPAFLRRVKYKS
jgi:cell division protein FtsZ